MCDWPNSPRGNWRGSVGSADSVNVVVVIQRDLVLDSGSKICLLLAGYQCFPTAVMANDNACKAPTHDTVRRVKDILHRK